MRFECITKPQKHQPLLAGRWEGKGRAETEKRRVAFGCERLAQRLVDLFIELLHQPGLGRGKTGSGFASKHDGLTYLFQLAALARGVSASALAMLAYH